MKELISEYKKSIVFLGLEMKKETFRAIVKSCVLVR